MDGLRDSNNSLNRGARLLGGNNTQPVNHGRVDAAADRHRARLQTCLTHVVVEQACFMHDPFLGVELPLRPERKQALVEFWCEAIGADLGPNFGYFGHSPLQGAVLWLNVRGQNSLKIRRLTSAGGSSVPACLLLLLPPPPAAAARRLRTRAAVSLAAAPRFTQRWMGGAEREPKRAAKHAPHTPLEWPTDSHTTRQFRLVCEGCGAALFFSVVARCCGSCESSSLACV